MPDVEQIVIHRAGFEGEHDVSVTCWCRPVVVDANDHRDTEQIIAETETLDG